MSQALRDLEEMLIAQGWAPIRHCDEMSDRAPLTHWIAPSHERVVIEVKEEPNPKEKLMLWSEIPEVVVNHTPVVLEDCAWTNVTRIWDDCWLFGPYLDEEEEPKETRIFVVWQKTPIGYSFQLLVQDCEGDFLNADAQGAEKYNIGVVNVPAASVAS